MIEPRSAMHDDQGRPLDHPLAIDRELGADHVEKEPRRSDVDVHERPLPLKGS